MTATAMRLRSALVLAMTLVLAGLATVLQTPLPARADEATKVLLVLDVSGSMNERISSGGTKFAAAKKALKQVAAALPPGTQVGLRVYGSEIAEPKAQNPKACTDTRLVLPIGPLDQGQMDKAVDSFTAKGETPIAYSLGKAVDDLGDSGKRVLVLISDGEETCAGDPCPVAEKLADRGVDLQFNAIGLDVGAKARKQLRCIADAGDGSYYDADRSGELSEALRKITQRALRPFQITGTPVKGTKAEAAAPTLTAGQFQDRYDASDTKRYYRIERTPGSTVTVSVTSLLTPWRGSAGDRWQIRLSSGSTACSFGVTDASAYTSVTVASAAVRTSAVGAPAACSTGPLLLALNRASQVGDKRTAPVEIVVSEEATITNQASLPKPVTTYDGQAKAVPASTPVRPATGGTSFSNAAELTPGSWSETLTIGETLFYKVHLDTGQRLRATLQAPAPKTSTSLSYAETVAPTVQLFSASRTELIRRYAVLQNGGRESITVATPQVRVRNRQQPVTGLSDRIGFAAAAGDYFVAIQINPTQADLAGRLLPVRLKVAVDGTATGQPQYETPATASPTPSASPAGSGSPSPAAGASSTPGASTTTGPGSSLAVPALGTVLALGVLGAAAALLLRRRSARTRRSPQ